MGNIQGRESTAERLAADLRRRILSGELAPGLRLPPERTLAEDWDANRHTVREALRLLEAQGLLETRQGSGATILDFRVRGRLEIAPYYFEAVGLDPSLRPEVEAFLGLRRQVLVEASYHCAREGTPEARRRLFELAREIEAARQDPRRVAELDFIFYGAMIDATGRLIFRWALNSFAEKLQPLMEDLAFVWPRPESYFQAITAIAAKLAAGAAEEAREATRRHLEETDAQIMEALGAFLEAGRGAARGNGEGGSR